MRILVTGGAGFIGSHVSEALLSAGHEVAVLDDLSSGRKENVAEGAHFVQGDIRDADAVERLLADFKPERITHQAAQTSVSVSTREPLRDADVNVRGTITLLEAAVRHKVSAVVFASTGGAIYGEVPGDERADETWSPCPLSPYACSKLAGEAYLRYYNAEHGLPYTILRYANVYGPRQDPHGEAGVVAIFSQRVLAGEPIRVNAMKTPGDDGCIRDYVFVGDVVTANLKALARELEPPIVNVATGVPTTTRSLATDIIQACGMEASVSDGPRRAGDLERSVLAPGPFGVPNPVSMADGIAATVDGFVPVAEPRADDLSGGPLTTSLAGLLITLYLLSGRWSPGRLLDGFDTVLVEPRLWIVAALAALAISPLAARPHLRTPGPLLFVLGATAYGSYALLSSVWAPDVGLARDKSLDVVLLGIGTVATYHLITTLGPLAVADAVWTWLLRLAGALAALAILGSVAGSGRIAVLGGGPNVFGRNMGFLVVACLGVALRRPGQVRWILGLVMAAVLVILSGSRGAMIATAFGVLATVAFMQARLTRLMAAAVAVTAVAMVVASYTELGAQAMEMFRERVLRLLIEEQYAAGRYRIYEEAMAMGLRHPVAGAGLAAFPAMTMFAYPHNMFLEAFCEGGTVGFLLLAATTAWLVLLLLRGGRVELGECAGATILVLVASQFSGDVYDTRGIYLFGLLAVTVAADKLYSNMTQRS